MLNKKGQRPSEAPLLSPLKIILGFLLIILGLFILFALISSQVEKHKDSTISVVSSNLAREKWFEVLNRKVEGETVPSILDNHYSLK